MAKVKKLDLKSVQNRNRENLHRRWKMILENEIRTSNNATDKPNGNNNQNNSMLK